MNDSPLGVRFYGTDEDIIKSVDPMQLIYGLTPDEAFIYLSLTINNFAKFCAPAVATIDYPQLIEALWNTIINGVMSLQTRRGDMQLALGIPRGFTKTVIAKLLILFLVIYTRHTFIAVTASTESNAQNIVKDILSIMDQPHFIALYGDYRLNIRTSNAELRHFMFRDKEIIFKPKGVLTSIRGLNVENRRPDVILMDDIIGSEEAKSPIQSAAIFDWMINTLLPAASTSGAIALYLGNMYDSPGCILSKLKKDPNWLTLTLGAILEDGTSLWEALHPITKLLASYNQAVYNGFEADWLAQYMNGVQNSVSKHLDTEKVLEVYAKKFGQMPPETQGTFIIIDPSGSKLTSDDTAIIACGISDGSGVVLEVSSSIKDPLNTIKTALQLALKYHAGYIFVESVAYQATLLFWADKLTKALQLDSLISWHELQPERRSKLSRILISFAQLQKGQFYVAPLAWGAYKSEAASLKMLSSSNVDNIVDACHYVPSIVAKYGEKICTSYSKFHYTVVAAKSYSLLKVLKREAPL